MPFTLAHPALILPLCHKKYRLSFTALVVGSMVPDLEFFMQMREVENIGHHWYGVFLFDIPAALLICYIFHGFLKTDLVNSLPNWYRIRLIPLLSFNWNTYAAKNKIRVLLSVTIGIASHLFIDGFTHHDGLFVQWFPVLAFRPGFFGVNMPVYYLIQVAGSVTGLLLVHRFLAKMPETALPVAKQETAYIFWPVFLIMLVAILAIRILLWPQYNSFWGIVMALMGASMYAWLLISLVYFKLIMLKSK